MRALMSMPEAMPERSLGTEPVVVLVTGVLVRPSPVPANTQPASMVNQLACSTLLPHFINNWQRLHKVLLPASPEVSSGDRAHSASNQKMTKMI